MIELAEDLNNLQDIHKRIYNTKNGTYSDTIYTFDIETTSLFKIDGVWQSFDPSIPNNSTDDVVGYDQIEKAVCPYIGMFSIEDDVYYFRDMSKFEDILKKISNPDLSKTVWIHNAGFEFSFYAHIFSKYTISNMIARKARVPICFYIVELNIIIRCSLRLTELSLERCGQQFTDIRKKTGDLDYNIVRSPLSHLTDRELGYCEYDCKVLAETVRYFLKEYKHIKRIPLTLTGIVRRAYKQRCPKDHNRKMARLVPGVKEYKMLYTAFQGGITHANVLYVGQTMHNVLSLDECSAYPAVMLYEKYPCEHFTPCHGVTDLDTDKYAYLYDVTFYNVEAVYFNHYIMASKCIEVSNPLYDNGRLVSADMVRLVICDIDFEIISKNYEFSDIFYHEIWKAKKDYLPRHYILYILELYNNKTKLKGVTNEEIPGAPELYQRSKSQLNSLFGCCCTNEIQATCDFSDGKWHTAPITDQIIADKLREKRHGYNNLFSYSTGVWITAYNRLRLFEKILDIPDLDTDVIYYDTDSLKIQNGEKYLPRFEAYNMEVDNKILEMCNHYDIDFELTRPKDPKGVAHPIGHWEIDSDPKGYQEFRTLGAKRYAYRENGEMHITISGVGKAGVAALHDDIENFNENLFFGFEDAHKMEHIYIDDQPPFTFYDYEGIPYECTWPCGTCLKPTTYSMSLSAYFEYVVNLLQQKYYEDPEIMTRKRRAKDAEKGKICKA